MNDLLLRLRDKGNTVLVVEHKPEVIAIADHVVDLGPGAGTRRRRGGVRGHVEGLRPAAPHRPPPRRPGGAQADRCAPTGVLEVRGANTHNLQDVDVDIPLGVLVVVTGVAGSGKSSLIHGSVSGRDGRGGVDQGADPGLAAQQPGDLHRAARPIRKAFAKANGVKPALFSANSEGACPACNGAGVIYTDLAMMAGVATPCEDCEGKRFQAEVLEYRLGGLNIAEVLDDAGRRGGRVLRRRRGHDPAAQAILAAPGRCRARVPAPRPAAHHAVGRRAAAAQAGHPDGARRAASTCSTSRPPACTWPTSSSCSGCSTGWSTPASRSSSSSTTRR
jgi:hypothetical protein